MKNVLVFATYRLQCTHTTTDCYLNIKLLYDYAFKHFINIKTFYQHNDSSILLTARSFISLDGADQAKIEQNRRRVLLK